MIQRMNSRNLAIAKGIQKDTHRFCLSVIQVISSLGTIDRYLE